MKASSMKALAEKSILSGWYNTIESAAKAGEMELTVYSGTLNPDLIKDLLANGYSVADHKGSWIISWENPNE